MKTVDYFRKKGFILDIWQGSEYASVFQAHKDYLPKSCRIFWNIQFSKHCVGYLAQILRLILSKFKQIIYFYCLDLEEIEVNKFT